MASTFHLPVTSLLLLLSLIVGACLASDNNCPSDSPDEPSIKIVNGDVMVSLGCDKRLFATVAGKEPVVLTEIPDMVDDVKTNLNSVITNIKSDVENSIHAVNASLISNIASMDSNLALVDDKLYNMSRDISASMGAMLAKYDAKLEVLTAMQECNNKGQILNKDGTCAYAAPLRCEDFDKTLIPSTRFSFFEEGKGVNQLGSTIFAPCKWDKSGRFFHPSVPTGKSECTVSGTWSSKKFPACTKVKECNEGQYMSVTPSISRDAQCTTCPSGTFQKSKNTSATKCTTWTSCSRSGYWLITKGTTKTDNNCGSCKSGSSGGPNGMCLKSLPVNRCSASSTYSGSYTCERAFPGRGGDWATRGQGSGAHYTMYFTKKSFVKQLYFIQRGCSCEWFRRAQLTFSNGDKRTVELRRSRTTTVSFTATSSAVTWVKMNFDQQWSRVNNGASEIQFRGWQE